MKAIGVDIIETDRIAEAIDRLGDRFLNRIFTPQELAYCEGRVPSLAARWAAKEAMGKAFGTGLGDARFDQIEVVCDRHGKPAIELHGAAKEMAQERDFTHIALSLSHTKEYAVAFVVVE